LTPPLGSSPRCVLISLAIRSGRSRAFHWLLRRSPKLRSCVIAPCSERTSRSNAECANISCANAVATSITQRARHRARSPTNRAGSKRHLRVRVLYAQPRSPVSVGRKLRQRRGMIALSRMDFEIKQHDMTARRALRRHVYRGEYKQQDHNQSDQRPCHVGSPWPAMGAGFFASHLHVTPFFRCIGGNRPARRYRRSSAKVLAWVTAAHSFIRAASSLRTQAG
jgi:hypothetical protein